jgi:hypothetical protein
VEKLSKESSFSELVGKIKAGLIETENVIVNNVLIAQNIVQIISTPKNYQSDY